MRRRGNKDSIYPTNARSTTPSIHRAHNIHLYITKYNELSTENHILFALMSIFLGNCRLRLGYATFCQWQIIHSASSMFAMRWDLIHITLTTRCTCIPIAVAVVDIIVIITIVFVVFVQTDVFACNSFAAAAATPIVAHESLFNSLSSNHDSLNAFDMCHEIRFNLIRQMRKS